MKDLIRVNNLAVHFLARGGRIDAVRDISFRVREGSSVAIVGESGSGKSVCAQAMMGILPQNGIIERGEILFRDPRDGSVTDLAKLDPRCADFRKIRGGRISIIFQEPMTSMSPLHTVGDQVTEAVTLHEKLSRKAAKKRCLDILRLVQFPDPEQAYGKYAFELSGGLRQRAMIAMAMICGPALLIADEPTTALDVTVQAQVLALVRSLQRELNMAVLMITHDMGVVANIAEEIIVVYKGEVMESGMTRDVLKNPQHPYLQGLLRAVPRIDAEPGELLIPFATDGDQPAPAPTAPVAQIKTPVEPDNNPVRPLLSLRGLVKTYQTKKSGSALIHRASEIITAVDHVEFDIRPGECFGLVGESGCGKTTIAKLIMGAIDVDEGQIFYDNSGDLVDLARLDDRDLVPYRPKIQYIFQDPFGSLNPRMTVFDILREPLRLHNIGNTKQQKERIFELMERVGLETHWLNRYPHSFSGGQRQRIGIARALALSPRLIICDEPVSALDVSTQAQVLNLLKSLQKDLGMTLLFISHDLAVVNYIADRVGVMMRGQLVELAPRAELFSRPQHPYTKTLLASVPSPDCDHPIDFDKLMSELMVDPEQWPVPFKAAKGEQLSLLPFTKQHLVRASHTPQEWNQT